VIAPRAAVSLVFMLNGAVSGSWASRVPALARQVDASAGSLGLALFGATVGLVVAATATGRVCAALGARALVGVSGLFSCLLLPSLGMAAEVWQLGTALFLIGMSAGTMDVAMNVAAVRVARDAAKPLMPSFHAAFSFGGLLGAGGAVLAASARIEPLAHFAIVAVVGAFIVVVTVHRVPATQPVAQHRQRSHASMRRPLLWLLAAIALCSALGEGATADWSALFLTQERGLPDGTAASGFAVFSITMGVTRLFGGLFQRRWGAVPVLAVGGLLAGAGWLAAVLVPLPVVAYAGLFLAGLGVACVFPIVLGIAGELGGPSGHGEREIGFVTAIGYAGVVAGPVLVGGLAQATSLPIALGVVGAIVMLMTPASLAASRADPVVRGHGAVAREAATPMA
jgi:MFS family permease